MAEEALLDMAEVAEDEPEQPISGTESEEQSGGEKAEGEAEKATLVTSLFQPDGKKLDPVVSKKLAAIKAENPDLGKLLSKAVYRVAELDREFPGGLTEARELRDKLEELGGFSAIETQLEGAKELQGLSEQFMAGDPAFVDDMLASSPEAFAALAPVVLDRFATAQPEAFAAHVGRIVFADMQRAQVPLLMMRLQDTLADNPKAVEIFEQLNGYLGGWKGLSDKQVPAVKPAATVPKKDDLSAREEALRTKEWKADRDTAQRTIVDAEYVKALAGRKPEAEERAQIRELFQFHAGRAADNLFKDWRKKSEDFIKRDDKAGYLRYMQSIYRRVAPEAMAKAVGLTLKGKKAVIPPLVKKPLAAPVKPAEGYKPVAKEPGTWDIDYSRTTKAMLDKNQAILKDGNKVQWK